MRRHFAYKKWIAIFVLLLPLLPAAQLPDYHLQLFDYSFGIKPGVIRNVARDNKGFLWILYQKMVQRFDGRKAESFPLEGKLNGLLCDEQGRLWVHATGRLYRFNEKSQSFRHISLTDSSIGNALPLFQTNDGRLYLVTAKALYRYNEENDNFVAGPAIPIAPPYSTSIVAAFDQSLFLAKRGMFFRYNLKTGQLDSLANTGARYLFPLHADSAMVTNWEGTTFWYHFAKGTMRQVESPQQILNEPKQLFYIRSRAKYANDQYFIASNTGIYTYNSKQQHFKKLLLYFNGRPLATNDYATDIHIDKEGYAWLSTVDGVARFSFGSQSIGLLRLHKTEDEIPAAVENVRNMVEDDKGNLWLATGHGFVMWNKSEGKWQFFLPQHNREDGLSYPSVRGLVYDGRNLIIGPTDKGTWIFDTKTLRYKRPIYDSKETKDWNQGDFVDAITTLRNGNHLVMGNSALYLIDGKTFHMRRLLSPATAENANYAFQASDGFIWLTTWQGLHLLDSACNYLTKVDLPTPGKIITAGFMLPDNRLLFSTGDGLYAVRYHSGKTELQKFTHLFDNILLAGIYLDKRGVLWASSENGIYRYDTATRKLDLFDFADHVQSYGFNGNSWLRTKEGYLFFGGENGINYLKPELVHAVQPKLNVYITQVQFGRSDSILYDLSRPMNIDYSQRAMEVNFSAPYFNNPDKLKFRYRLEGFDEEWKYLANNNAVRFTSLPSGNYRLKVEASTNGTDWIGALNTFSFRIKAPYWLQWWFIGLFALLTGSILGFYVRSRNKKLQDKEDELEAEQAIVFFASRMSEHNSVDAILWDVAKNCIGRLQFEDCVIYLVDEKRKVLVQKAAHGPKNPRALHIEDPIDIPIGQGITGTVAKTGRSEIIHDTTKEPRYIVDDERRYSEITVPIISGSTILGVIDCEHSKKGFFTQKHLSILTTIASLCANKIVRAKAQEEKLKAEKALMATRQKMADAEMQALRAQMNPHFIFNCLNSINRYIVKSDQATASLYLTRFAKLIRLILDNSNSKTITLSNELEALRLYIEMESIRFERKYHYSIKVDENIQPDSVYVPPLIIQPYVENAIWHGLLHKDSEGTLSINICCKRDGILECIIEDDGVGREKAKELRSKTASTKKSLGMKLTEDRLSLLSQQAKEQATVMVEDKKNSSGEPTGTKVIIKIPIE